ncbi:hypothetical protein D3C72_2056280 [compost metagenome]
MRPVHQHLGRTAVACLRVGAGPVAAQLDVVAVALVQHRQPGQLRQAIATGGEHGDEWITRQQAIQPLQVGLCESARGEHRLASGATAE